MVHFLVDFRQTLIQSKNFIPATICCEAFDTKKSTMSEKQTKNKKNFFLQITKSIRQTINTEKEHKMFNMNRVDPEQNMSKNVSTDNNGGTHFLFFFLFVNKNF